MTPQEKGDKLIEIFWNEIHNTHLSDWLIMQKATKCAIIAVEEIIKAFEMDDKQHKDCHNLNSPTFRFYEKVLNYLKSKL